MITVRLHDGREVDVQTDDPQKAAKIAHGYGKANPLPEASTKNTVASVAGHFLDGILPGASGFVRGAREVVKNAVQAPFSDEVDFNPQAAYRRGQEFQEARQKAATLEHPTASGTADIAGVLSGLALPTSKIARGASLGQKMLAGAKTAASYGALSAAMSSKADNLFDRAGDAVSGALSSGAVGAAFPVAGRIVSAAAAPAKPLVQPVVRRAGEAIETAARRLPDSPFTRKVAREAAQMARDPAQAAAYRQVDRDLRSATNPATGRDWTPMQVVDEVRRRQSIGVPAVPADVHEGARRAYGGAARTPGPALASVRRRIDERQQEAAERMAAHIRGTLGPTTNVDAQAEKLDAQARAAAAPLYAEAYAQPVTMTAELRELFDRPAGAAALRHGSEMMANRGVSPESVGLVQGPDGSYRLGNAPRMQAIDFAKTALDASAADVSNPMANSDARRAAGGADDIRRRLLEIMDGMDGEEGLNPLYKPARDAYAGPVENRKALQLGEASAGKDGEEIGNAMADLSDGQRAFFQLGHRSALARDVEKAGDWSNPAARVSGSLGKRKALQTAHGSAADGLMDRVAAEHEAHQTWKEIRGGAQGIDQEAAMDAQERQLAEGAHGFLRAIAGGPIEGAKAALGALLSGNREHAVIKGHIAKALTETDTDMLTDIVRNLYRERARSQSVDRNAARGVQKGSRFLGDLVGAGLVQPAESTDPRTR